MTRPATFCPQCTSFYVRIVFSENYLVRRTPPHISGRVISYEKCRKPRVGGACYVEMFECLFRLFHIQYILEKFPVFVNCGGKRSGPLLSSRDRSRSWRSKQPVDCYARLRLASQIKDLLTSFFLLAPPAFLLRKNRKNSRESLSLRVCLLVPLAKQSIFPVLSSRLDCFAAKGGSQ